MAYSIARKKLASLNIGESHCFVSLSSGAGVRPELHDSVAGTPGVTPWLGVGGGGGSGGTGIGSLVNDDGEKNNDRMSLRLSEAPGFV